MPSPFPGMNPYFEQAAHWLDFHTEFLSALRRLLAPQVAPKYIVQLEEHIYIHDLPPEPRQRLGTADLSLVQPGGGELAQSALGLLEAPAEVWLPEQDVEKVPFLEVRDRQGRELVTVIELLSPSNKRAGDDREQYLAKRRELLRSPAHLVEIDLLAGMDAHAPGRPARVRLFGDGQPGREATGRGLLAHPSSGPAAGHPHPAPAPGRRRAGRSPGSAAPSLRWPRLRALHLSRRARTEPLGERRGLGTAVRAGRRVRSSRDALDLPDRFSRSHVTLSSP